MNGQIVIAGTDTNIGKTILSAMLMSALDSLSYWKPVQSGICDETDTETVRRISGCATERILPEAYRLTQPLSPHLSARLDGTRIVADALKVPNRTPLIIELAGGLLVPLNNSTLQIDMVRTWGLPVVLATRSSLGTINHSLLSIEAMHRRNIEIAGFVSIGETNLENELAIAKYGRIPHLGRIERLENICKDTLVSEFKRNCDPLRVLLQ